MSRQHAGDSTQAVSDAQLDAWLANYGVRAVWTLEAGTSPDQNFALQTAAPLLPWPDTVTTLLYPEGTWVFADGGSLDLGLVRDSSLNLTNDAQVFAETFEEVFPQGVESYALQMDLCASGAAAAADAMAIDCAVAS